MALDWACRLICAAFVVLAVWPMGARAEESRALPSVLVVDSNTGDGAQCAYHWLGKDAEPLAERDDKGLYTCENPTWWAAAGGSGDAPATFVLYGSQAQPLTADDVIWALNALRKSGAEARTFVVAMGTAGLPVREYAEDLASKSQSSRADLVGFAFCGTPHNGYGASVSYPESVLWGKLAGSVGLAVQDLAPTSDYLSGLNAGAFPRVTKTLVLAGSLGDLGFGMTDGAGVAGELTPAATLSSQIETATVDATVGRALNLTGAWQPFTSSIDFPDRTVDKKLTELLAAMESYEISGEVQGKVREFYESWFAEGAPVTHNSSVLLLDLSGSMNESIDARNTKLQAAKEAAQEYLHAMSACSGLPQSAPMDVMIIGFGETTSRIATAYDAASCDAVARMEAFGETNIGIALDEALSALSSSPTCAFKHILLLSDGASTRGQTEEQMLAGPIAKAKKRGIVIDTVGFGDVGESDAGFLKRVAKKTGGTYYTARDTYTLKVNFLKAYYSSLGLGMVDEELKADATTTEVLGTVDGRTSALQIGVVSEGGTPEVSLVCNGEAVDASLYTTTVESGLTSLQYLEPQAGEYELRLTGGSGSKHVFAVRQQGIVRERAVAGEKRDLSLVLLAAAGVALVAALAGVVVLTRRKGRASDASGSAPLDTRAVPDARPSDSDATTLQDGSVPHKENGSDR